MRSRDKIVCVSSSDLFVDKIVQCAEIVDSELAIKVDRLAQFASAGDALRILHSQILVIDLSLPEKELGQLIEMLVALRGLGESSFAVLFLGAASQGIETELQLNSFVRIEMDELVDCLAERFAESRSQGENDSVASRELRAQNAVRESELAFRSIFAQSAIGIAILDSHAQRYVNVNDRYCEMTGLERHELERRSLNDLAQACQIHETLEQVLRLHADDFREFSFSGTFAQKCGASCQATLTLTPAYFGAGNQVQHFVILQEETEPVISRTDRYGEDSLRSLLNALPLACGILDSEFVVVEANADFAEQFPEDCISLHAEQLIGENSLTQSVVRELNERGEASFSLTIGEVKLQQKWIAESGLFGQGGRVLWLGQLPANTEQFQPEVSKRKMVVARLLRYLGTGYWQLHLAHDRIHFSPGLLGQKPLKMEEMLDESESGICYSEWLDQFTLQQKKDWLAALQRVLNSDGHVDCEVSFALNDELGSIPYRSLKLQLVEQLNGGEHVYGTFRFED